MKKIIMLLLIAFSFSQQEFHTQDITVSVDNSMQSIDINNYVPLVSGYYKVDPIFIDSFSGTIENVSVTFQWDTAPFYSQFGMQRNYDEWSGVVDIGVYDEVTISAQNSIINILWTETDDYVNESISFDIVLRVSGIFDDTQLSINDNSNIVHGYSLEKPYPNPFNPTATISFSIPSYEFVSIKIYNLTGQLVTTLFEKHMNPGRHNLTWNAKDYSSGQYFVKMKSENYSKTEIVTLVK